MGRKRRRSMSEAGDNPPKRQAREVIVIDDDEPEESLESILRRINEQEASEALARSLQGHPDVAGPSTHAGPSNSPLPAAGAPQVIDLEEDDEALALRLSREWAEEDAATPSAVSSSVVADASSAASVRTAGDSEPLSTPDIKIREYSDLYVGSRPCTKCKANIVSPRGYVTYTSRVPPPSLIVLLHATCASCKTNHCRGCFKVVPCIASCKGKNKDKDKECPVLSCCAEVRAIALFEALGGLDRHYLGERATSDSRSKEAAAAYRATKAASVGPGGTGYGTGTYTASFYLGRGSRVRAPDFSALATHSLSATLASRSDEDIVKALSTITMLLPAPYDDAAQIYDMLPHASIASLLQLSQLPALLARLLRNDSVADWISRDSVYHAMLALLRRMADCELTLDVLIGVRYEMKKSGGIEEYLWGDSNITWETVDGRPVKAQPLYGYFQKLTKQCETFLAGANKMLEDSQDGQAAGEDIEATIKGASLCGEIIVARENLERAMQALGKNPNALSASVSESEDPSVPSVNPKGKGKDKGKNVDRALEAERQYRQVCEKLAFEHVAFPQNGQNYATFNYNNELQLTARSTRTPRDRLHLIKELAVMATSLPSGVWVRVDEVRNDALKIMIAGPEGTPYEGGLFEFDCFIPLQYPNIPPLMHLRTTGGGTVRFNPNLYNNGKVCLSLLGTWQGRPEEQWSRKSTLLQVLVSIQSMILVELPYFNEPGFGQAHASHPGSIEYNKNTSVNTVRWAVVEWLKDEHRNGMWADVISSHFTLRAAKVRSCIEKWAKTTPRIRNFTPQPINDPGIGALGLGMNPYLPAPHVPPPTGSSWYTNAFNAYSQHLPSVPPRSLEPAGIDLLAAFDKGMETVRRWPQAWKK